MDRAGTESNCVGARGIVRHTAQREGPRNTNNSEESHEEVAAASAIRRYRSISHCKNVMLNSLTAFCGLANCVFLVSEFQRPTTSAALTII
jgi:hypothetical protein